MPPLIADAAKEGGWSQAIMSRVDGGLWFRMSRGECEVIARYDYWRHTTARAYRGNALTAILRTQQEVAAYLTT